MTAATVPGIDDAPTENARLLSWVREVAELTTPDRIVWCDGSEEEWERVTTRLVEAGTFVRLTAKPNSFWAASDPDDVARVEERTFICSLLESDAGVTNNWCEPAEMKAVMTELYRGCMRGRTMYVIPFCMGPTTAEKPMLGVEITDSEYVVASMRIMTRMGAEVLPLFDGPAGDDFVPALHSIGAPLEPGQEDVPWPCNKTKYIAHFPEERLIWSYGSGYGGNALLGKKCYSLRIASAMARDEGWLAEHMLILKLISPEKKVVLHRRGVPVRVRQDQPRDARTDGPRLEGRDPRRRHRVDALRRRRPALRGQPRVRLLRRRAGHELVDQPERDAHDRAGPLAVHQRRADRRRRHLVGGHGEHARARDVVEEEGLDAGLRVDAATPTPATARRWRSARCSRPSGTTRRACRSRRSSSADGARRRSRWSPSRATGSTAPSSARPCRREKTAAATGGLGQVRRDPMAMLPFIGYNVGDYFQHWINVGKGADAAKLPRIFYVNWFRRGDDGRFLWPGFGENSRVLKWAIERIEGKSDRAGDRRSGSCRPADDLDLDGLDVHRADVDEALAVDPAEWSAEIPLIEEWFH